MNDHDLSTRIRELRQAAGLTQKQAAKHAGVSPLGWSRWENDRFSPRAHRIGAIAAAIGVPVSALFAEPGTHAIADIVITDAALERIKRGGAPEVRVLTGRIADSLAPALRAAATPHTQAAQPRPIARRPRIRPSRRARSSMDDSNTS